MRPDENHEQLADELEKGADELAERSEELEDEIDDARGEAAARRREDRVDGPPGSPQDD